MSYRCGSKITKCSSAMDNHYDQFDCFECGNMSVFGVFDKFPEGFGLSDIKKKGCTMNNSDQFGGNSCYHECDEAYNMSYSKKYNGKNGYNGSCGQNYKDHMASSGQKRNGHIRSGFAETVGIGEEEAVMNSEGSFKHNKFVSNQENHKEYEEKREEVNKEKNVSHKFEDKRFDEKNETTTTSMHASNHQDHQVNTGGSVESIKILEGTKMTSANSGLHGGGRHHQQQEVRRQQANISGGSSVHHNNREEAFIKKMMSHEKLRSQASWLHNEVSNVEAFMCNVLSNMKMKAWDEEAFITSFFQEKAKLQRMKGQKQQGSSFFHEDEQFCANTNNFCGQPRRMVSQEKYYKGNPCPRGEWYTSETYTYRWN